MTMPRMTHFNPSCRNVNKTWRLAILVPGGSTSTLPSAYTQRARLRRVDSVRRVESFQLTPRLRRVDSVRHVESFRLITATPPRRLLRPNATQLCPPHRQLPAINKAKCFSTKSQ
jgi:hypothetical protein